MSVNVMAPKGQKQIPWSSEEDEILKKYYSQIGKTAMHNIRQQLMNLLPDRTWVAIVHRANNLGISPMGPKKLELTEGEKGFLGGIIFGEGCITMTRGGNGSRNKYYISPRIIFTNTSQRLMAWLKEKFIESNLQIYESMKPRTETQKPCHVIVVAGSPSVYAILETCYDYLVDKQAQADILMDYAAGKIGRPIREPSNVDPLEVMEKIHRLNRKGRVSATYDDHIKAFPFDPSKSTLP